MFCQTNKEGDGAHRVGSESDVLDYAEARIELSLAELAAGDDGTSAGDDAKVCMVWHVVSPTINSRKYSNVATSSRHRSFFRVVGGKSNLTNAETLNCVNTPCPPRFSPVFLSSLFSGEDP